MLHLSSRRAGSSGSPPPSAPLRTLAMVLLSLPAGALADPSMLPCTAAICSSCSSGLSCTPCRRSIAGRGPSLKNGFGFPSAAGRKEPTWRLLQAALRRTLLQEPCLSTPFDRPFGCGAPSGTVSSLAAAASPASPSLGIAGGARPASPSSMEPWRKRRIALAEQPETLRNAPVPPSSLSTFWSVYPIGDVSASSKRLLPDSASWSRPPMLSPHSGHLACSVGRPQSAMKYW
mmetsp:Transcript_34758/g.68602  ORF Transcript_34758/g.68602 Transcript_34758/m.68602 type:complete len:232 (-) Transcript_34758:366-1061(-)